MDNRPFGSINQVEDFMTEATFIRIAPFIYLGGFRPVDILTNINTATHLQLVEANFTHEEASRILAVRPILRPSQLDHWHIAVRPELREGISLYTNINTASRGELLTLDSAMSQSIVSRIVAHRGDQPFGSFAEVEEFFGADQAMRDLYQRIRNFIILR